MARRIGGINLDRLALPSFSDALHAVYEAALDPDHWPVALSHIGKIFEAEGAVVIFYSGNAQADFITCEELRPAVEIYQTEGWWRHDLHAQRAIAQNLSDGDVFSDLTVASPDEIETHPIYVDFFERVGFGCLMSAVMLPDLDMLVGLSVPRGRAKGFFNRNDMNLLSLISRHVEQSLRISLRITSLEASEAALAAAVDSMDACIYALDEEGRVVFANASGLARFADYFVLVESRIAPREAAERVSFQTFLDADARGDVRASPRSCVISGSDGSRLAVWAMPMTNAGRGLIAAQDSATTLLFATPVERRDMIDPAVIRDIFDLSLGEARLAALVGGGMEIREVAGRLGITEGTARIVLKRVFRKLGINRQAQLVLQLSHLAQFRALRAGAGPGRSG